MPPPWSLTPALATDRLWQPASTRYADRGAHTVVVTDERPDYRCGNLVLLHEPPTPRELADAARLWRRELGDRPRIEAPRIEWEHDRPLRPDEVEGYWRAASRLRLAVEHDAVMRLAHPPSPAAGDPAPRLLAGDSDWAALRDLQALDGAPLDFVDWQLAHYRRGAEAGRGSWWGIDDGGAIVASVGLLQAPAVARFNSFITRPSHRRRGLCAALCRHLSARAATADPAAAVVIVAEAGSPAQRIYARCGFETVGARVTLAAA